jgi:hypothetical protein
MAWSPDPSSNPILTVNINTQFSQSFSYTDDGEIPETFSITSVVAAEPDSGVTTGTSVSGAYTGKLHGGLTVLFMKEDETYITVDTFDDIEGAYEICSYTAPSEQEHTNTYTVTATGDQGTVVSASFDIVSVFNWDTGKTALINAIAETRIGRD